MDIINLLILLIVFVLIFVSVIVLFSSTQLRQKKYLLSKLDGLNFDKVKIRFSQSSVGVGRIIVVIPVKAEMYIADELILITPKERGYFNGFSNLNLPIVFVKNRNQKTNVNNAFVPDKVKISKWNSIEIEYHKVSFGNVRYTIQIDLLDKNDIEKINRIKNWC